MNERIEAVVFILMAVFVMAYGMLDIRIAAALATVFLIVFAFYKFRQPRGRTR